MPYLYHFTCEIHLPGIMREGIYRGDVPLSPTTGFNAPWLTSDPNWEPNKSWGGSSERAGTEVDKNKFRLTVNIPEYLLKTPEGEIPIADLNLHWWPKFAWDQGVSPEWYQAMDNTAGGYSGNHYLYMGHIPREWIHEVDARSKLKVPDVGSGKVGINKAVVFPTSSKHPYFSVGHLSGNDPKGLHFHPKEIWGGHPIEDRLGEREVPEGGGITSFCNPDRMSDDCPLFCHSSEKNPLCWTLGMLGEGEGRATERELRKLSSPPPDSKILSTALHQFALCACDNPEPVELDLTHPHVHSKYLKKLTHGYAEESVSGETVETVMELLTSPGMLNHAALASKNS